MQSHVGIIKFLTERPDIRIPVWIFVGSVIFLFMFVAILADFNRKISEELDDEEDEDSSRFDYLIRSISYSKNNELLIYDLGYRFCRKGNCVSNMLSNIKDVTYSGSKEDRVLDVTYAKDGQLVTEKIYCGQMDVIEFRKIKKILLDGKLY